MAARSFPRGLAWKRLMAAGRSSAGVAISSTSITGQTRSRLTIPLFATLVDPPNKIGRASCRERVCQYVSISVVAGTLKKKNTKTTNHTTPRQHQDDQELNKRIIPP